MIKPFRRIKVMDRETSQVQDQIADTLIPISKVTLLNGIQIDNIQVTSSAIVFNHQLNRQPLGWFIVDQQGAGSVHRVDWNTKNIELASSADVTISIWVY